MKGTDPHWYDDLHFSSPDDEEENLFGFPHNFPKGATKPTSDWWTPYNRAIEENKRKEAERKRKFTPKKYRKGEEK